MQAGNDAAIVEAVLNPQLAAGMIAAAVALVTAVLTAIVTVILADRRGKLDQRLTEAKGDFERELAELNARLDDRAAYAAERVAHELLMHEKWEQRSFDAIEAKLGGFDPDALRQILVQAGAVRFEGKGGKELWGLLDRNRDKLA